MFIAVVIGVAACGATFSLWQVKNRFLPASVPKITYQDICDDPKKIGLAVSDGPLPEHLYRAVDAAEGDNAASIAARAWANTALKAGNTEWHFRNMAMTLYYELAVSRNALVEFVANCGYFGRNTVGVTEAAQVYLGKPVSDVTLGEAAMLAGLLKGPSSYDPAEHPERATQRRDMILDMMFARGTITSAAMAAAKREPVIPATVESR